VVQVQGGDVENLCFEMAKQCAFQLIWPDSGSTTQCYHVNKQGLIEEMLIEEIHGTTISPWTGDVDLPPDVIISAKPHELPMSNPNNALFLQMEKKLSELDPFTSHTYRERVTSSFIYDQIDYPPEKPPEQKIIVIDACVDYLIINQAFRTLRERTMNTNIAVLIHTRHSFEDDFKNMAHFKYKPTPDAHRNIRIGIAELANLPEFSKHKAYFENLPPVVLSKLTLLMKHIPRQMVRRLLGSTMVECGTFDLGFLRNYVASICREQGFDTSHLHPTVTREKVDLRPAKSEPVEEEIIEEPTTVEQITKVSSKNSWASLKGLDSFVNWAKGMGRLFSPEAKEYGFVRYPTGVILTGVPGCGKTMAANIIANEWGMGFKRVSVDMITGRFVGENEENIKNLLNELEQEAPIICFVDEAEKLFAQVRTGKTYQAADAGRDGTESILLQFMEENNSGVFFVFTSNDLGKLSPALVDRFDERFFVDLPSTQSREDMIASMLEERKQASKEFDLAKLATISEGFTGRDIRSAIEEAMMNSFMDGGRKMNTTDLIDTFQRVSPTSVTLKSEIESMRQLVLEGKVRSANTHEGTLQPSSTFDPSIG
jgi:adenylate kinase family enzyme